MNRVVTRRSKGAIFLVALAALLFAFVVLPIQLAGAHANQIRSSPAANSVLDEPPDRIIVWFSEEIEASLSQVRVLDELAREVDNGDSAISPTEPTALIATLPELANGTYTVVWRNLSTVDGHRVVGSFRFAIGEPLSEGAGLSVESQPLVQSGADPWLRWTFFIGALGLTGILLFDLLVVRAMLRSDDTDRLSPVLFRRLQTSTAKLMLVSIGLMAFGMVALLVQQASVTFEVSFYRVFGDPLRTVLESEWGRLWTWRAIAVVSAGVMVFLARRSVLDNEPETPEEEPDEEESGDEYEPDETAFTESVFGGLALASALAVLGLTSLSSHNAAVPVELRTPAIISDFLHLIAASAWVGGLFFIALAIPQLFRSASPEIQMSQLIPLLKRFTPIAVVSAGTVVVTGLFAGYMQVTIPAATNTPYGWALVAKLVLLVPLFAIAGANSYIVSRRLLRSGPFQFRSLVRSEALLGLLVLAALGWMVGLEPARQFAGRTGIGVSDSVTFSDFAEGANVDVKIDPGDVGVNAVAVSLTDRRGSPITNANDVRVRLKFLEDDLGEPLVSLIDQGGGVWVGDDFNITIGGVYQVEVRVIRPDAFDALTSFRFDAAPVAAAADAIRPTQTVTWTLFAIELLIIGLLFLFVGVPMLEGVISASRAVMVPGAALSLVGIVLLLNAQVFRAGFPEDRFNPFPLNSESIELGSAPYATTCAACHGITGLGDGPQAGELASPPADLSVHVPLHADSDLFGFIRDGIPGTAMPGQDGVLTEDQMWHLVNFLRTFEQ